MVARVLHIGSALPLLCAIVANKDDTISKTAG
jgi:hypothetical protein